MYNFAATRAIFCEPSKCWLVQVFVVVAKKQRMPCLYRSFPVKEPCNWGLFYGKRPATASHRNADWHRPLLRVLCHFTGFARLVWGRSQAQLPHPESFVYCLCLFSKCHQNIDWPKSLCPHNYHKAESDTPPDHACHCPRTHTNTRQNTHTVSVFH